MLIGLKIPRPGHIYGLLFHVLPFHFNTLLYYISVYHTLPLDSDIFHFFHCIVYLSYIYAHNSGIAFKFSTDHRQFIQ